MRVRIDGRARLFCQFDLASRVRADHTLRAIHDVVNAALAAMSSDFDYPRLARPGKRSNATHPGYRRTRPSPFGSITAMSLATSAMRRSEVGGKGECIDNLALALLGVVHGDIILRAPVRRSIVPPILAISDKASIKVRSKSAVWDDDYLFRTNNDLRAIPRSSADDVSLDRRNHVMVLGDGVVVRWFRRQPLGVRGGTCD